MIFYSLLTVFIAATLTIQQASAACTLAVRTGVPNSFEVAPQYGKTLFENQNAIFKATYDCKLSSCQLMEPSCSSNENRADFGLATVKGGYSITITGSSTGYGTNYCFKCSYEDSSTGASSSITKGFFLDSWGSHGNVNPLLDPCPHTPKTGPLELKTPLDLTASSLSLSGYKPSSFMIERSEACPFSLCTIAAAPDKMALSSREEEFAIKIDATALWSGSMTLTCEDYTKLASVSMTVTASVACGASSSQLSPPVTLQSKVVYANGDPAPASIFDHFTCPKCGSPSEYCSFSYLLGADDSATDFDGVVDPTGLAFDPTTRSVQALDPTVPGTFSYFVYASNDGGNTAFKTTSAISLEYVCGPTTAKEAPEEAMVVSRRSSLSQARVDLFSLFDFNAADTTLCTGITFGASGYSTCALDADELSPKVSLSSSVASLDLNVLSPVSQIEEQCFIAIDKAGGQACQKIKFHVCGDESVSSTPISASFQQFDGEFDGQRNYGRIPYATWSKSIKVTSSICTELVFSLVQQEGSSWEAYSGFEILIDEATNDLLVWTDLGKKQTYYLEINTITSVHAAEIVPIQVEIEKMQYSRTPLVLLFPATYPNSSNSTEEEEPKGEEADALATLIPIIKVDIQENDENEKDQGQNFIIEKLPDPLRMRISSISNLGELELAFSEPVTPVSLEGLNSSVLEMFIEPSYELDSDFNVSSLNFSWEARSLSGTSLKVHLEFNQPAAISSQIEQDTIIVNVLRPDLFQASSSGEVLHKSSQHLASWITVQMENSFGTRTLQQSGAATKNGFLWLLVVFFALDFALQGAMRFMLLFIGSLMLIVHLPMLKLVFPANVNAFFGHLLPVVMFDVLPPEYTSEKVLSFDKSLEEELSTLRPGQVQDLGYESHNSILNLGSIAVFIAFYLLQTAFFFLLLPFRKWVGEHRVNHIKHALFFQDILGILSESYTELLISGLLNLPAKRLEANGEVAAWVLSLVILFLTIFVVPVLILWLSTRSKETLKSAAYATKFQVLYEELRLEKHTLAYLPLFLLRRAVFVFASFFVRTPSLQMCALLTMNLIQMIYFGNCAPYTERKMNRVQLVNEVFITSISILLIFYTQWNPHSGLKVDAGWVQIGLLGLMIVFNLFVIFKIGVWKAVLVYARLRNRWKARRAKQQASKALKSPMASKPSRDLQYLPSTNPSKAARTPKASRKSTLRKRSSTRVVGVEGLSKTVSLEIPNQVDEKPEIAYIDTFREDALFKDPISFSTQPKVKNVNKMNRMIRFQRGESLGSALRQLDFNIEVELCLPEVPDYPQKPGKKSRRKHRK